MSNMKLIRISGIESESIVDGKGIRYVIFTQGCPHHCPGCHNPQTHPFDGGKLVSIEDILDDISKRKNWIDGITISGGEPFCQIYQCALIAEKAHEMGLSVWCYTGYLFEDLYGQGIELLKHIDVLVDGPFVQAEKSLELDFRGSRNQRVIDIPESLKEGVAILKPNYEALKNIEREEDERFHRLLHTLFYLCELADFEIEGRIILVDKRNGRVWR